MSSNQDPDMENIVVPVIEERLSIEKREVETGTTRIAKTVNRVRSVVDEPLLRRFYDVTRVPVNRVVDAPAEPRQEGDTLILPVYEEQVVVEKRLVLVEEVHVTRKQEERRDPQEYELLKEVVSVSRSAKGEES